MRPSGMPLLDPDPVARPRVSGAAPPAHFEGAVARAVERIRAGELEKVVLAREVRVHTRSPHRRRRRSSTPCAPAFPECFCFCVGTPEAAFVGASPELLVRREGSRVGTMALAGTTRRSADPAVDDHLGEQLRASPKNAQEHRDRGGPHPSGALEPGLAVGHRRRRPGAGEGAERAAPGHADPRPAARPRSVVELAACCIPRPRWAASRARWPSR